ncbi:MAG: hypothetical protein D6808_07000 [Candidatus Dadabacteria bacterium]|nr:MAG: hypothetical protein D6808_07000 [Candidatus Dadabacteria bacterium]
MFAEKGKDVGGNIPGETVTGPMSTVSRVFSAVRVTERIYIGNFKANHPDVYKRLGIEGVISLNGDEIADGGPERRMVANLVDGSGNDARLCNLIVRKLEEFAALGHTLVFCHAGRSRSVVIVAAYLMRQFGLEPWEALDYIKSIKECAVCSDMERLLLHLDCSSEKKTGDNLLDAAGPGKDLSELNHPKAF